MVKKTKINKLGLYAQASLELTASMIGVTVIITAIIMVFVWLNNGLFHRQEAFEEVGKTAEFYGRERAGKYNLHTEVQVDESQLDESKLNIFNENEE